MHKDKKISKYCSMGNNNPKTFGLLCFIGAPIIWIWGIGGSVSSFIENITQFSNTNRY
jgi:hypothetical protein